MADDMLCNSDIGFDEELHVYTPLLLPPNKYVMSQVCPFVCQSVCQLVTGNSDKLWMDFYEIL